MEAAWLTAVALGPCLCNPYSGNNFGPEKAALLHALALLTAGAWLVRRLIDGRGDQTHGGWSGWRGFCLRPLTWTLTVLVLVYVLSTCLSVDPGQSIWGDWQTRAGAYTFLACVLFFAAIAANLRSREQVERFVTAVLVGSLPVSLYAIIQRLHLDPVNWGAMTSLLGHPLYVAAYLGMVFPLCLWRISNLLPRLDPGLKPKLGFSRRLADSLKAILPLPFRRGEGRGEGSLSHQVNSSSKPKRIALGCYCLLALLQLAALILANERGPVLGLLTALVCFFVLVSVCWNLRRLLASALLVAGAILAFLVVLNIPGGPLEPLRSWPALDRFAHGLFSAREGTGFFRADLWKECPKLMLSHQPIRRPDGANDALLPVRLWLGYGPETTSGVLAQRYTVPRSGATLEDRFHNRIWDLWESVGALGVAAFLSLFVALYHRGLRQLGLILNPRDSVVFCALVAGLAIFGALVLSLWQGYGFAGLGLQLGMAAGCVTYPLKALITRPQPPHEAPLGADQTPFSPAASGAPRASGPSLLLTIALLSALAMHLVETGFAFPTAATATLFWTFAGLLLALQRQTAFSAQPQTESRPQQHQTGAGGGTAFSVPAAPKSKSQTLKQPRAHPGQKLPNLVPAVGPRLKWNAIRSALFPAALTTMLLVPLINMFLLRYTHQLLSSSDFIAHALESSRLDAAARNGAPFFVVAVWLGSAWLLAGPGFNLSAGSAWASRFLEALLISGGATVIYAVWNGAQLASIGPLPQGSAEAWGLLRQARGYENLFWTSMALILALVLVAGCGCSGLPFVQLPKPATVGLLAGLGALASAGAIAIDVSPSRADISLRWAGVLQSQKIWPACQQVFERAIQLSPTQFIYRSKLAEALRDQAQAARDPAARNQLNNQAEQVLQEAKGLPGYNRRAWHLGQLYLGWAEREENPVHRLELAQQAKSSFEEALSWEPKSAPLWSDYGFVDMAFLNNEQQGLRENQKALDLDPGCEQAHGRFADFYAKKSAEAKDPDARRLLARKAVRSYAQAAGNTGSPFPYLIASGSLLLDLHDWAKAVDQFALACNFAKPAQAAQTEEMLARAYLGAGNHTAALQHLHSAIAKATPEQKPALVELEKRVSSGGP